MLVLKLKLGSDIRRISLEAPLATIQELNALIRSEFNNLTENLLYSYVDSEGDAIRVTNDRELSEAWRCAQLNESHVLQLKINNTNNKVEEFSDMIGNFDVCQWVDQAKQHWKARCKAGKSLDKRDKKARCFKLKKIAFFGVGLFVLAHICHCLTPFFIIGLLIFGAFKLFRCHRGLDRNSMPCRSICNTFAAACASPNNLNNNVNNINNNNNNSMELNQEIPIPMQDKLKQLQDMGFMDRTKNISTLVRNGGDLLQSVKDLLEKSN